MQFDLPPDLITDTQGVYISHSFRINEKYLIFYLLIADRIRTVSQRSKPNSRITLMGEQPNLWNHLQLQDVMSRHRGAKQIRRYGL